MKIEGIKNISPSKEIIVSQKGSSRGFGEVLNQVQQSAQKDFYQEIQGVYQELEKGSSLTPKDLFMYQVKAGNYFLKVELISKAAESASGTFRKLQNGQ
ncbi:MAG: hypothetical protein ACOX2O_10690 [Bdellovibrionota bacterium]|jgi:hypothetical protein